MTRYASFCIWRTLVPPPMYNRLITHQIPAESCHGVPEIADGFGLVFQGTPDHRSAEFHPAGVLFPVIIQRGGDDLGSGLPGHVDDAPLHGHHKLAGCQVPCPLREPEDGLALRQIFQHCVLGCGHVLLALAVDPDGAVEDEEYPVDKGQILLAAEDIAAPLGHPEHDGGVLKSRMICRKNDGFPKDWLTVAHNFDPAPHLCPGEEHQQWIQPVPQPDAKPGIRDRFSFILFLKCGFLLHYSIPLPDTQIVRLFFS